MWMWCNSQWVYQSLSGKLWRPDKEGYGAVPYTIPRGASLQKAVGLLPLELTLWELRWRVKIKV